MVSQKIFFHRSVGHNIWWQKSRSDLKMVKICKLREGCTKKNPEKMWSFAKLGGGGVSDGSKMPNFYFGKVFFQLACRIILGPPKHVLHLV